jgi:hypothetical protein
MNNTTTTHRPAEAGQARIERAIALATTAHAGQADKVGQPYIYHPVRVGMALAHQRFSDDQVVAAILHDVVEDTPMTVEMVEVSFGLRVAQLVDALSRREDEGYKTYIRRLARTPGAAEIKLEDLADNFFPGRGYTPHPSTASNARWAKRLLERTVGYSRLMMRHDPKWRTTWN